MLLDLHKFSRLSPSDQDLLNDYFAPVSGLSHKMEKHIQVVMTNTLNAVRQNPKVSSFKIKHACVLQCKTLLSRAHSTVLSPQLIVTCLRIVEREEKYDAEALQQEKTSKFLAPDRPKRWKDKVMKVLAKKVTERIEGNMLEVREENKMWLVRHLECIRKFTLDDLRIVKTLCQPVFPPKYEILDYYISLYNDAIQVGPLFQN